MTGDRDLPSTGATWTASSDQPWLSVVPASGTIHPRENVPLSLHVAVNSAPEAWLGPMSTVNAPFVDATPTYSGWGNWVGNALLVWGGDPAVPGKYYDPVSDTWYGTMNMVGAPSKRLAFTAVWTGTEMIVWGGYTPSPLVAFNTGARYNPATDTWTPMSTVGAPSARSGHRAVWTGTKMIVWGGDGLGFTYTNTGASYDPVTDTWLGPTSTVNAPPVRGSHALVWTGTRMIVWGGENPGKLNTGYFYDPSTDTWSGTTTSVGAPVARSHLEGVWTGQEMIVWGGSPGGSVALDTGARYNPVTDTWTPTTVVGAPEARSIQVMAWTGSTMIVWGGVNPSTPINTGAIYRPPQPTALALGLHTAHVTIAAHVGLNVYTQTVTVTLNVAP